MPSIKNIDWQGHRGARGLLPENSIPAFLKALEFPVQTLELDVVVSKDGQLIISHEPWFSAEICSKPDGSPVTEAEEKRLLIYNLTYDQIKTYDCGRRGNPSFPQQKPLPTYKPSLKEMVVAVDAQAAELQRPLPRYNIELKSEPDFYGKLVPAPDTFVQIVLSELAELQLEDRVTLQSFDLNCLEAIHRQKPRITTALLVENTDSFADNLARLSFQPTIYSPYFEVLTKAVVAEVHAKGMRLVPWTVNEKTDMRRLVSIGVDGIITDYPDRVAALLAEKD